MLSLKPESLDIDTETFRDFFDGAFVEEAEVKVEAVRVNGVATRLSNELSNTLKVVLLPRIGDAFLEYRKDNNYLKKKFFFSETNILDREY